MASMALSPNGSVSFNFIPINIPTPDMALPAPVHIESSLAALLCSLMASYIPPDLKSNLLPPALFVYGDLMLPSTLASILKKETLSWRAMTRASLIGYTRCARRSDQIPALVRDTVMAPKYTITIDDENRGIVQDLLLFGLSERERMVLRSHVGQEYQEEEVDAYLRSADGEIREVKAKTYMWSDGITPLFGTNEKEWTLEEYARGQGTIASIKEGDLNVEGMFPFES